MLFPFEEIRPAQKELIAEVSKAVGEGKDLIAHAPTGIGKTAATLAPALNYALANKKVVFFLTSRHTQHHIAIETLKKMKERHGVGINVIDIIGKQAMCPVDKVDTLFNNEFMEFCKKAREDEKCEFYMNVKSKDTTKEKKGKKKLSVQAQKIYEELLTLSPCDVEDNIRICSEAKLCPYEMSMIMAKEAHVIIADYYYMFYPSIRDIILNRIGKELSDCIVIVDEGHNLPGRMRELMTHKLSSFIVRRAIKEAKRNGYDEIMEWLEGILKIIESFAGEIEYGFERLVDKEDFTDEVKKIDDYDQMMDRMMFVGDVIRTEQRQSFIGVVGGFMKEWLGKDEGYARIFSIDRSKKDKGATLSYRCLDPSLLTKEALDQIHSTIMMSGTLTPTEMYKDLLGFKNDTIEREYPQPFPEENRLALVVPKTTTKYAARSEEQYKNISLVCSAIVEAVGGNTAIFFPSYAIKDNVAKYLVQDCVKTVFDEYPKMTKEEKQEFLERFKGYQKKGAVLLGVTSGSFGEGIDLPGDLLKGVIVVGLPLQPPDLETKKLIEYYEEEFGQGWDYAYIYPALTKAFQNAGRCIRSEEDKGVIVFLDERYAYQRYLKCFPKGWNMEIGGDFIGRIEEFMGRK